MSSVTVRQLADVVGIPVDRLLDQLGDAGLSVGGPDTAISDEDKVRLLGHLRKSHGKKVTTASPAETGSTEKISLRRRSVSELKQGSSKAPARTARTPGAKPGAKKTVTVEVRRNRTLGKSAGREDLAVQEEEVEAARQALAEQEKAKEALAAETRARKEKGAEMRAAEQNRLDDRQAASKAVEEQKAEETRVAKEQQVRAEAEAQQAQPAPAKKQDATPARKADTGKRGKGGKRSYGGREELHVKAGSKGRRKKKHSARRPVNVDADSKHGFALPTDPVIHEVKIPDTITVPELAQQMSVKAGEVIKTLMGMGTMVTINQVIDQDTAGLVVEEMGHTYVMVQEADVEENLLGEVEQVGEQITRPPVVTIMGHVDHGKTSLLDHIRESKVTAGEAGGITQHIGAYRVETGKGTIAFLDTPGHAAFTAMRARGAKVTDIVILIVAADDGVMPQTIEAIQHAKAGNVPMIVAINKIDREEADPDRVKQELTKHEVIPEDWGGEYQFVNVSAITGEGIDDLLDSILLQAEVLELKASIEGPASGAVVEASLDKGRGAVATILVQSGTLRKGDTILAGQEYGRVRAMFDESGAALTEAGPSTPVAVLGLSGAPNAGDEMVALADEKKAREVAELRKTRIRETRLAKQKAAKLEEVFASMSEGEISSLNIVVKADVHGSVEALQQSLANLSTDEIKVNIVSGGVGGINESDVNLAMASNAIIVGFNVRADASARSMINEEGIDLHYHSIIYDVIDSVKRSINGILGPIIKEQIVGLAEVREVFTSPKLGLIAGCMVVDGVVKRNNPIRVLRDNIVIYEGALESLRRFKDDVSEVKNDTECGIGVKNYTDVKPGDQIEVFERIQVEREI